MTVNPKQLSNHCATTNWFSVVILAIAAIVFVTAELIPVGILPQISTTFHESIGRVGLMVTGYAWTVAVSAVFVTSWLAPLERRKLLVLITGLFALANVGVAVSPSLSWLFLARVIGAFGHGVFWSIVGPLCLRLSGNLSKTKSTAFVFGGMALATVIAVPLGTVFAQWFGWRIVFLAIASLSFIVCIVIRIQFPKLPSETQSHLHLIPRLLTHPLLRRVFPATVLAIAGHFCALTYISVLLEKGVGISHNYLAYYLFLFGIAGVTGNILVGRLKDHYLERACPIVMVLMAIVIVLLACLPVGQNFMAAVMVIIWGGGICVLAVSLQSLILTLSDELSSAASSFYVSMFNAGIGSGALIGGFCADYFSIDTVAWAAGLCLLCAALIISGHNFFQFNRSYISIEYRRAKLEPKVQEEQ